MYSCANYPRGCRGRVNIPGGKCSDCMTLKLRRPSALSSPLSQPRDHYRRPYLAETPRESEIKIDEV
ncbi:hypothetical protein DTO212C5_7538 [Paecilomyces variotii]|nr:hypothetical protein DTO212C5_7538 [Paecilomyces variotii]